MGPCFNDIKVVIQKAFNHTVPGGWIAFVDGVWELRCTDGSTSGTALERYYKLLSVAGENSGRDMSKAKHYKRLLLEAGYVEVFEKIIPTPCGPWHEDRMKKRHGFWMRHQMLRAAESYRNFLLYSGLSAQEIDLLLIETKRDMMDTSIHYYMDM